MDERNGKGFSDPYLRYRTGPVVQITARDKEHTLYNKRSGDAHLETSVAVCADHWVCLEFIETTATANGMTRSKTISKSFPWADALRIVDLITNAATHEAALKAKENGNA